MKICESYRIKRMERYINDLIARMSDRSISEKAYREAEQIKEGAYLSILVNFILSHGKPQDKTSRRNAYFIFGKILLVQQPTEYIEFFITQITLETDKYLLSSMLDLLSNFNIPSSVSMKSVIDLTKEDAWLVRHSAIQALSAKSSPETRQAAIFFLLQEDEKKFRSEIIYANACLNKIGTSDDIQYIRNHVQSQIHDIRDSALYALKSIENRGLQYNSKPTSSSLAITTNLHATKNKLSK